MYFTRRRLLAMSIISLCANANAALPSAYSIIEDASTGAKVTTSFSHGQGITNPNSAPDPYGYYSTNFPSMNDFNDVVGQVPKSLSTQPSLVTDNAGEAAVWKGSTDAGTGTRTRTNLGVVGCPDVNGDGFADNSFCGSRALTINLYGLIGGSSHDISSGGTYPEKSYVWANGWMREAFLSYNDSSFVAGINNSNNRVGSGIDNIDYGAHGQVRVNGGVYRVGAAYTQPSYAFAINNNNKVTGDATFGNVHHAYIWSPSGTPNTANSEGTIEDIGSLGGAAAFSVGYDINDSDNIVGYALSSSGTWSHAFLYTRATKTMKDLGTLTGGATSIACLSG